MVGPNGPVWGLMGPYWGPNGPQKGAKMVSADTIFSRFSITSAQFLGRFSITSAQFLGRMVGEMAQKPSKCEEHIYSKRLRPKNKNGQNYPILGLTDGGGHGATWLLEIKIYNLRT